MDSYFPRLDNDTRWDYVGRLRPAFRALLEAFQEEVGRERALDDILGRVDEARVAVSTERLAQRAGAAVATDSDQAAYLHWLIDTNRYLRTAGLVSNTTVQIPLQDVFVSLRGIREARPGDRGEEWRNQEHQALDSKLESGELDQVAYEAALDRLAIQVGYERSAARIEETAAPVAVTDAVRGASHLLVLGDPGCGKTTLLRYLRSATLEPCYERTPTATRISAGPGCVVTSREVPQALKALEREHQGQQMRIGASMVTCPKNLVGRWTQAR